VSERRRILVVDDQRDILDLTAAVLNSAGYVVETLSSGIDALQRVTSGNFDMVLLDINMPSMDGWETLRLIRADADLAELAVVMFSVKGEVRDKVQSLQEGAADFITKPFEVDELLARVARVLEPRSGTMRVDPSRDAVK